MFCEVGVWRNFDDLESSLTLDELFLAYEKSAERQERMMKALAAAMGADTSGGSAGSDEMIPIDQHQGTSTPYQEGPIMAPDANVRGGGQTLFGYHKAGQDE